MSYKEAESLENVCCKFCKKILILVLQDEAILLHVPIESSKTQELVLNPEDITVVKKGPEAPQLLGAHIGKHKC